MRFEKIREGLAGFEGLEYCLEKMGAWQDCAIRGFEGCWCFERLEAWGRSAGLYSRSF